MRRRTAGLAVLAASLVVSAVASAAAPPYKAPGVAAGKTIVIDGALGDWQEGGKFLAPAMELGFPYQAVRGAIDGADDSSGRVYIMWSKDCLLLAADITDDEGVLSAGRIDNGDSVGVLIDTSDGATAETALSVEATPYPEGDDWSLATLVRLTGSAANWSSAMDNSVKVRAKRKPKGGYTLEAAIPLADIEFQGGTFKPAVVKQVPFSVILTDCDDGTARKSVLQYTRTEDNAIGSWYNTPAAYGQLIFVGEGSGTVK